MSPNICPDKWQLSDYRLGRLDEELLESIASHIDQCERCLDALTSIATDGETDAVIESLKRIKSHANSNQPNLQAAIALSLHLADGGSADQTPRRLREYELLEKLGAGGMGVVYKALHTKLDKLVAVKLLPSTRTNNADVVAGFNEEMKAIGRLEHPNIVRATDAGEHDGQHYLVMEYVEGIDLSMLLRKLGPLPVAAAAELVRRAAIGLQYVHDQGLIHRDVKPSNLMLALDGTVKVLDLGLARLHRTTAGDDPVYGRQIVGTANYMAPEQATVGQPVDSRADLWGLGATLYKLLTNSTPLQQSKQTRRANAETVNWEFSAPEIRDALDPTDTPLDIKPISECRDDLPPELIGLIDQMLDIDPGRRPENARVVAEALVPFSDRAVLATAVEQVFALPIAADEPAGVATATRTQTDRGIARLWWVAAVIIVAFVAMFAFRENPNQSETSPPVIQTTQTTVGSTSTLAKTGDLNRDAANYVRQLGGSIWIRINDSERQWRAEEPLPEGSFEVTSIDFQLGVEGRDIDLGQVANLTSLHGLSLINEHSITDEDLAHLLSFPNLRYLTLNGVRITDGGLVHLAELKQLESLTLRLVPVGDDGIEPLRNLINLSSLSLAGTDVSDAGLEHLKPLHQLSDLDLRGTQVSDEGIAKLIVLKSLRSLRLGQDRGIWGETPATPITAACVEHLAKLPDLTNLYLEGMSLPGESLGQLTGLTVLQVGAGFTDNDLSSLARSLHGLTTLSVEDAQDISFVGIAPLVEWKSLTKLRLDGTSVTDEGLESLLQLPNLQSLSLDRTLITDRGLSLIAQTQNDKLTSLAIRGTDTSHQAIQQLGPSLLNCRVQFEAPHQLWRMFERGLTSIDIEVAGETRRVRTDDELPQAFRIRGHLDANRASQALLDKLIQLRNELQLVDSISVSDSPEIDSRFLYALRGLRHLKKLDLSNTQLSGSALDELRGCQRLESLDLSGTRIGDAALPALLRLPKLNTLSLQGTRITDRATDVLQKLVGLAMLDVSDNGLSEEAVAKLKVALPDSEVRP